MAPKRRPPAPPTPDEVLVPKRVPKPPVMAELSPKPPKAKKPPKAPKEPRTAPLRWLPGWLAALLTGAACGALTVVLAWATAQGCDAVRGVGTCGSFGIVALVAILGIDVIVATGLLRLFRVGDPTTTSVLGVGLVAVSAMLFFLKDTQSHAMVYVIPILMAITFAMSWWVTQAITPGNDD
ncbi:MAG TPA: MFS transporter [Marmoricola sp.]|nr:MFS transporter [Marmoricola sp.]